MLKVESYKKGIVLSTFFNVFNKGFVFLNALLVSYFFSVKEGSDLFFYIFNLTLILGAFFTSMNSSVIIPESMRIRAEKGEDASMKFLNFIIYAYIGLVFIGLVIISINPTGFFSTISKFQKDDLIERRSLLYLSLPLFGMICIINLLIDILTSYKFFTVSMLTGIINGACSIVFILLLHNSLGIYSAFYGLIVAYLINLTALFFLMKKYIGWKFTRFKPLIEKRVWKNIGFAQLGNLSSSISSYMPFYLLSGFNPGVITALAFAQQISSLPNALITNQFSSVAAIKLNELFAVAKTSEIDKVFTETANLLHFVMIPLSCLIFLYSNQIVDILANFTSIDKNVASYTSTFMKYLGFLLPFYVSNTLVSRLFMASHKIKEAFWYQLLFNLVQIASLYVAVQIFGVIAYPITLIAIYSTSTLLYYFVEKHYFNMIGYDRILKNFVLFLLINALVASLVFYSIMALGIADKWIMLTVAFTLQITLLLIANHILRMSELVSRHIHNFTLQLNEKVFIKNKKIKDGI